MTPLLVIRVAVPSPLYRLFDYLPPLQTNTAQAQSEKNDTWGRLKPGCRVLVPFGRQKLTGIIVEIDTHSNTAPNKLKPIIQLLDQSPLLPADTLLLCSWLADYYHHPIGETLQQALPTRLRKGGEAKRRYQKGYQATDNNILETIETLSRAPKQQAALQTIATLGLAKLEQLKQHQISPQTIKSLIDKGLIIEKQLPWTKTEAPTKTSRPPKLNHEQEHAVNQVCSELAHFRPFLLEGITGSGKTEVYLHIIEQALAQNTQALVLVPEIGLTPQTVSRFEARFDCPIAVIHSGLNDKERMEAWLAAASGDARILIGTRSASLTPMPELGVIIIDEEHDGSFKQQEGLRYNARDTAIKRAQLHNIPIILGSATPSLESLANSEHGRYQHLSLKQRAGEAQAASIELLDIRHAPLNEGLSEALCSAIHHTIDQHEQVMVFINRRGFSPALICHDCGWTADCTFCDMKMTVHRQPPHLHCHHCDYQSTIPSQCPHCHSQQLEFIGSGTERTELALTQLFPDTPIYRIDRDSTQHKQAFEDIINTIHTGEPCILVGTQMLAKGHHFPNVTLVGIIEADAGLFSADFRSSERFGQLLTQVAGRAGRAEKPGKVLIQTHLPEHPLLNSLITQGYSTYGRNLLAERRQNALPPFCQMSLIRANHTDPMKGQLLLQQARLFLDQQSQSLQAQSASAAQATCWGPTQAPVAKRAGRYRWQLYLQTTDRRLRHQLLNQLIAWLNQQALGKSARWSIDIDPMDIY